MKRPIPVRSRAAAHAAFTLVEILMALALSLLLLGAVITMFGKVSESIGDSRSLLEMADRLRLAETRLQLDLAGVTATMNPPRNPANNEAYFEYIEGGTTISALAKNTDVSPNVPDTTVGEVGDILMFTTRSTGRPFVGKRNGNPVESYVAEVAWFVRGRTLHRRVLLVLPGAVTNDPAKGFYANNDISVHLNAGGTTVTANTLADLTLRECRFAHSSSAFPASASVWGQLGLPTLAECSDANYDLANLPTASYPGAKTDPPGIDFWSNRTSRTNADSLPWGDNVLFQNGSRITDDIILTNVIGFDVKRWDSTANAYVDLSGAGNTYDTWSTTYFGTLWNDGIDKDANGTANGIVDDDSEKTNPPPYAVPLRGIQVKIRVFEPDSKQIREVTVVQDFLPQ